MRIVHAIASSRGGGAIHLQRLARQQAAEGHLVTVVVPDEGELSPARLREAGLKPLPPPGPAGLSARTLPWLRAQLQREQPDVLHCHGARAALWARLAVAGPARPRVLVSLHGFTAPFRPPARRAAMWLGEQALRPLTDAYVAGCLSTLR